MRPRATITATRLDLRAFALLCSACGPLGVVRGSTQDKTVSETRAASAAHLVAEHGANYATFEET